MKINYLTKAIATIGLAGSLALSGCVKENQNVQTEKGIVESENVLDFRNDCSIDEFYDEENQFCSNVKISDLELKSLELKDDPISMADYENTLSEVCAKYTVKYDDVVMLHDMVQKVKVKTQKNDYKKITSEIENKIIDAYKNKTEIKVDDLAMYLIARQKAGETSTTSEEDQTIKKNTHLANYSDYLEFANTWKNKDYVKTDAYFRISTLASGEEAGSSRQDIMSNFFVERGAKLESVLEQFPVKEKYPSIPRWAWSLAGWIFPLVRNIGLTGYLTKGKGRGSRYAGGVGSGLMNGIFGTLFLDGLHPLVFPARMLATPFVAQLLFKASGFYDDNDGSNPVLSEFD